MSRNISDPITVPNPCSDQDVLAVLHEYVLMEL